MFLKNSLICVQIDSSFECYQEASFRDKCVPLTLYEHLFVSLRWMVNAANPELFQNSHNLSRYNRVFFFLFLHYFYQQEMLSLHLNIKCILQPGIKIAIKMQRKKSCFSIKEK